MSTISNNQLRRQQRGPERFRWQRKEPPCPCLSFILPVSFLFIVIILLSTICIGREANIATSSSDIIFDDASTVDDDVTIITKNIKKATHTNNKQLRGHHHHHQHHHDSIQIETGTASESVLSEFAKKLPVADAIVVGSGLAGLTATLKILDRGGRVILIEKESTWGGNSNKASSGMNSCCHPNDNNNDTIAVFTRDTVKSAGDAADLELINTLVENSAEALTWFQNRVGVDLSVLSQLGGHSRKRTHRPKNGFVGSEIISAMELAIRQYEQQEDDSGNSRVTVLVDTQVSQILYDKGKTIGVVARTKTKNKNNNKFQTGVENNETTRTATLLRLRTDHVVLATGGFASDRSPGSYLEKYRPELLGMAATAGEFSTGDGITLAEQLGAATRDMDKVQIHPTGFVDPADPNNPSKVLAAELLRGVGGILLDHNGQRFCNELGTRAYVTDKMLEQNNPEYANSRIWNINTPIPTFFIVLSSSAAKDARKHVDMYLRKGLVNQVEGIHHLANHLKISYKSLSKSLKDYYESAAALTKGTNNADMFGKTVFNGIPPTLTDFDEETFYVGEVTPALHYCMGGIKIDKRGNVLTDANNQPITGLHAAGEVTGGVHGNNRLGGNSLLECAVYGSIVGQDIPIPHPTPTPNALSSKRKGDNTQQRNKSNVKMISFAELSEHSTPDDAWVAIHGKVYDLSSFAHPGGDKSILSLAGTDGTEIFSSIHSTTVLSLSRVEELQVGILDTSSDAPPPKKTIPVPQITLEELGKHNTEDDCWISLYGTVYDLTEFSKTHPGGAYIIQKHAGQDATMNYGVFHPKAKLLAMKHTIIGTIAGGDDSGATES